MAITLGVHASAGSGNGTTATTPARTTTPGSALCVVTQAYDTSGSQPPAAVSDNKGNTFTLIGTAGFPNTTSGQNEFLAIYYCENIAGGAGHTITATSTYYPSIAWVELQGAAVKFDAGKSAFATDTSSPFTAGPITPSANGAAIVSALVPKSAGSGSHTLAAPGATLEDITDVGSYFLLALGGFVQSTAAAYTASWTVADGSAQNAVGVVAFVETGGGGPTPTEATLAVTLGAASASATAVSTISAAVDRTLGAATCVATGAQPAPSGSGSVSVTLAAAAVVAAGSSTVSATLAGVLGDATVVAAGAAEIRGAVSASLGAATVAATNITTAVPAIGSHTLKWVYEGSGTDPHVSDPITTQNGSMLLVSVAAANGIDAVPSDNKGNTFTRVGSRINYTLWSGYGISVWVAEDILGGAGHTVSVEKDLAPTAEMSMHVIEFRGATAIHGAMNEVLYPNDLVSAEVVTTKPSMLYGHWWGDSAAGVSSITPRDSFTALESAIADANFIQFAGAYQAAPAAGTYSLGWDEAPQQGAVMGLFAIEGAEAPATSNGTLTATLGAASVSAAGDAPVSAAVASSLAAATLAGAAEAPVQAVLAVGLAAASVVAAGAQTTQTAASLSVTLAAATIAADAKSIVQASMEVTLAGAVVAADAASTITASLDAVLADAGVAATGALDARAAAAITTDGASVSSQGTSQTVTTGTLTAQLDAAAVTAAGAALIQALLARPLDGVAAAVTAESSVTGALAVTLESASLQATTTAPAEAVVAALLANAVVAATAARLAAGALDLVLDAAGCVATGAAIDVPPGPPLIPIIVERPTAQLGTAARPEEAVGTVERPS